MISGISPSRRLENLDVAIKGITLAEIWRVLSLISVCRNFTKQTLKESLKTLKP
jgi:hypothetical protein